jgi:hypothetical protein
MANVVRFDVGGRQYKVSCSLLEMHPNTMLARSASEQWQANPGGEIFLERDGDRFKYVLDYLRDDGRVYLPANVFMAAFLADLVYYGIEVDESKIVCNFGSAARSLAWMEDEIKSWRTNLSVVTVAEDCASQYMQTRQLENIIYHPAHPFSTKGNSKKAQTLWDALSTLLVPHPGGQNSISDGGKEECNVYLHKIGLEIVTVASLEIASAVKVTMKLIDM